MHRKVNHLIAFGSGIFHTNSIEFIWRSVKLKEHYFSGINTCDVCNYIVTNDFTEEAIEYVPNWVTYDY